MSSYHYIHQCNAGMALDIKQIQTAGLRESFLVGSDVVIIMMATP